MLSTQIPSMNVTFPFIYLASWSIHNLIQHLYESFNYNSRCTHYEESVIDKLRMVYFFDSSYDENSLNIVGYSLLFQS